MSDPKSQSADAWSRYWASGALHSCPNAFGGNYDDEIREHWMEFFSRLPDGARVLDIGTGNGAVAFLALDAGRSLGRTFHVEGIDAAAIDPAAAARRHGIEAGTVAFHGGRSFEETEFPSGRFDAVSSQFAVEYGDVAKALGEAARILKPGGRAGFVIHHAQSEALEVARAELSVFDFLRDDAPLLLESCELLKNLLPAGSAGELAGLMQDSALQAQDRKVHELLRSVAEFARTRPSAAFAEDIAKQVALTFRRITETGPVSALERLANLGDEMAAHRSRLLGICEAAHDRQDIEDFCRLANLAGFSAGAPRVLERRGVDLLGWAVLVTRQD